MAMTIEQHAARAYTNVARARYASMDTPDLLGRIALLRRWAITPRRALRIAMMRCALISREG